MQTLKQPLLDPKVQNFKPWKRRAPGACSVWVSMEHAIEAQLDFARLQL